MKMLYRPRIRLPHITQEGAYYIITIRLYAGKLTDEEKLIVLNHIRSGHDKFYRLVAVQVMPDHVHFVLKPEPGYDLKRIMKGIKGVSARKINQNRKSHGSIWMTDYFDRIVRSQSDLEEKLNYMYENPVRAGIVEDANNYSGWYYQE